MVHSFITSLISGISTSFRPNATVNTSVVEVVPLAPPQSKATVKSPAPLPTYEDVILRKDVQARDSKDVDLFLPTWILRMLRIEY